MDRNNDCYFYFYSTCIKGNKCPFRHCDLALGSEVVCEPWRVGRCQDLKCPFRHMEPNINRQKILCWFESQPSGCLKPHCVFRHNKPRPSVADKQHSPADLILPTRSNTLSHNTIQSLVDVKSSNGDVRTSKQSETINISIEKDDESDDPENHNCYDKNEAQKKVPEEKTLEQLRMEMILNSTHDLSEVDLKSTDNIRRINLLKELEMDQHASIQLKDHAEQSQIVIKTLDQIRQERDKLGTKSISDDENPSIKENEAPNLEKRSIEDVKPSKPVKLRRNRLTTKFNNELNEEPCPSNENRKAETEETRQGNNDDHQATINSTGDVLDNVKKTLEGDLEFEFLSAIGLSSTDACADVALEEDELMREIDQVINS